MLTANELPAYDELNQDFEKELMNRVYLFVESLCIISIISKNRTCHFCKGWD
jgi:hypothetical protein